VALPSRELTEDDRKVLWHYLSDVQTKLAVFDPLLAKVEVFNGIVNTHFLFKSFKVDKTTGFAFQSETGDTVPMRTLSSGEQHELVLAYDLLFKVTPNSLILIDEPELSLHVTWQHLFLDDLDSISKLTNLDFLVATHSPAIIHKRRALMVTLGKRPKT
jgi:predicted ATP-binding protein involved in virulence